MYYIMQINNSLTNNNQRYLHSMQSSEKRNNKIWKYYLSLFTFTSHDYHQTGYHKLHNTYVKIVKCCNERENEF